MTTTISSRWTPFYRYFVPVMTIGGLSYAVYIAWRHPEQHMLPSGVPREYSWLIVACIGALVLVILRWTLGGLKQVELDGDELIISDFRSEIRVPLAAVEKISRRTLSDPPRYTITFAEETEFGRRVRFVAPRRWGFIQRFSDTDEIVELRRAWEVARAAAEHR